MEYKYEALDQNGKPIAGMVNAASEDTAIESLQKKGLTITSSQPEVIRAFCNPSVTSPFLAASQAEKWCAFPSNSNAL